MQPQNQEKAKGLLLQSAKECAYLATFVALTITVQALLSFLAGIELVTVLFVSYSFARGARRGMLAATAFSLLRNFVFELYPTVLLLYLVYYNFLALLFGFIGRNAKKTLKALPWLTATACLCTVMFTMLDNLITPLWYGYSAEATRLYFYASLPFMLPQVVCTAISVFCLFLPLHKVFSLLKK